MTRTPGDEDGYGTLLARLIRDGERFAKARIYLYRAIVFYRVSQMRAPVVLMLGGALLAGAAIVALFLGIVLALAQSTGPLLAGIIIFAAGLVLAAVLIVVGYSTMPDITDLDLDDEGFLELEAELAADEEAPAP